MQLYICPCKRILGLFLNCLVDWLVNYRVSESISESIVQASVHLCPSDPDCLYLWQLWTWMCILKIRIVWEMIIVFKIWAVFLLISPTVSYNITHLGVDQWSKSKQFVLLVRKQSMPHPVINFPNITCADEYLWRLLLLIKRNMRLVVS